VLSKSGSRSVGISAKVIFFYSTPMLVPIERLWLRLVNQATIRRMEKLNNRYVKLGIIGVAAFVITRLIIAIINGYINPDVPIAAVISLIVAGVVVWFAAKAIHY
jgi:hypothetical protein